MPLPVFNSCCCGCTLRTGSLIVGYFGVIVSLIFIIASAIGFANLSETISDTIPGGWHANIITVLAISMAIYVTEFVFYCFLVVGAHKDNARWLRTFVIAATITLGLSVLGSVLNFLISDFTTAVANLIGIFLQAYFILIVRSFYLEIESSRQDIHLQGQAPQVSPPGHPAQPGYPAQQSYAAQMGYPTQQSYPAQPDYPVQPGYQAQSGYPAQPSYRAQPGYPAQPDYPAQSVYQSQPAYQTHPGWVAPPDYTVQQAYPDQPAYQNQTHGYPVHRNCEVNPENEGLSPSK